MFDIRYFCILNLELAIGEGASCSRVYPVLATAERCQSHQPHELVRGVWGWVGIIRGAGEFKQFILLWIGLLRRGSNIISLSISLNSPSPRMMLSGMPTPRTSPWGCPKFTRSAGIGSLDTRLYRKEIGGFRKILHFGIPDRNAEPRRKTDTPGNSNRLNLSFPRLFRRCPLKTRPKLVFFRDILFPLNSPNLSKFTRSADDAVVIGYPTNKSMGLIRLATPPALMFDGLDTPDKTHFRRLQCLSRGLQKV